ncbi:hypothetical protein WISP_125392 [Willisornis vidua]|uniref:Uncharacterized protein n=1 Tax=Willisornis vidua TaxID=1566151 RepID=A0ABQ9CS53_9PASS|nr:hypothetical protein WISP_125392 [Willisornis vidua]
MLDLVLMDREGLVGNVKLQGSLDCSDHEMVIENREALMDWRKANVTPVFKKEDPGNYRPVNPTSVLGKVMEQIILAIISKYVEEGCQD